jgi:hypothetical protein
VTVVSLSGKVLCDELIAPAEEFHRVWCVSVIVRPEQ